MLIQNNCTKIFSKIINLLIKKCLKSHVNNTRPTYYIIGLSTTKSPLRIELKFETSTTTLTRI